MNKHLALAKKITATLDLPMKVISVEEDEDDSLIFHFSSEAHVDFRELVKKLQEEIKRKISMHQIGAREEAKMLSGVGPCGKKLCCATFLKTLPVLPENLQNDDKMGTCGKTMCCLVFEERNNKITQENIQPIKEDLRPETPSPTREAARPQTRILRVLPRKKGRHRK